MCSTHWWANNSQSAISKYQCVLKYGWRSWLSLSTAVAQHEISLLFLSNAVLTPQAFTSTAAVCLLCLLFLLCLLSQHMPENDKQKWTWRLLAFLKKYCIVILVPSCSRTFVACWRDSSPSTLSLLPMTLRTLQLQSCARTRYLEILLGLVFTEFMFYFGEELATFGYVVGVFPTKEI